MQTIIAGNSIRESVRSAFEIAQQTDDTVSFQWNTSTIVVTLESQVEIQFAKEANIQYAVLHSIRMAQRLEQNVSFQFGGITVIVEPHSDFDGVIERWDRELRSSMRMDIVARLEALRSKLQGSSERELKQIVLAVLGAEIARLSSEGATDLRLLEPALSKIFGD
ncbi:hypothetical protein BH10CYA1_BH10CYA1_18130 [soil metagenome]